MAFPPTKNKPTPGKKPALAIAIGIGKPKGKPSPDDEDDDLGAPDPVEGKDDTETEPDEDDKGGGAGTSLYPDEVGYSEGSCVSCTFNEEGHCSRYSFPVTDEGHCLKGYQAKDDNGSDGAMGTGHSAPPAGGPPGGMPPMGGAGQAA